MAHGRPAALKATPVRTIGYFSSRASSPADPTRMGFEAGMWELGYIEGENLVIEHHFGQLDPERVVKAYAEDVRAGKNDRRRNFVRKMNYICRQRVMESD